ncbi:MAG: dienelactone hydrolase family protein [Candidatus Levybacteria bacterium]|nr:dienelactone hydrolase family protein [Candidatus Levybacteria bacterium]
MKKGILISVIISITVLSGLIFISFNKQIKIVSPLGDLSKIKEKPLEKYTFDNLRKTNFTGSEISIGKLLKDGDGFSSYMFYYYVKDKKVSGLINLPKNDGTYPVVVMIRGYVDHDKYSIGEGTRRSAETIASSGFITLAPDFLGYGESDNPSNSSIEERFQTYTTALTLLTSIKNLNRGLESISCNSDSGQARMTSFWGASATPESKVNKNCLSTNVKADIDKIGIWGHSNGGHIALSVLEISGKSYQTVLWAPVSKPFPYSILYFTDEFDDHGKALRRAVANFEKDYDIEKYSPTNYYSWINAPIQLHQGEADEAVPLKWSDLLSETLKKLNKDVTYFTYSGENHNFNNGSWPTAIQRSINFYKEKL